MSSTPGKNATSPNVSGSFLADSNASRPMDMSQLRKSAKPSSEHPFPSINAAAQRSKSYISSIRVANSLRKSTISPGVIPESKRISVAHWRSMLPSALFGSISARDASTMFQNISTLMIPRTMSHRLARSKSIIELELRHLSRPREAEWERGRVEASQEQSFHSSLSSPRVPRPPASELRTLPAGFVSLSLLIAVSGPPQSRCTGLGGR